MVAGGGFDSSAALPNSPTNHDYLSTTNGQGYFKMANRRLRGQQRNESSRWTCISSQMPGATACEATANRSQLQLHLWTTYDKRQPTFTITKSQKISPRSQEAQAARAVTRRCSRTPTAHFISIGILPNPSPSMRITTLSINLQCLTFFADPGAPPPHQLNELIGRDIP